MENAEEKNAKPIAPPLKVMKLDAGKVRYFEFENQYWLCLADCMRAVKTDYNKVYKYIDRLMARKFLAIVGDGNRNRTQEMWFVPAENLAAFGTKQETELAESFLAAIPEEEQEAKKRLPVWNSFKDKLPRVGIPFVWCIDDIGVSAFHMAVLEDGSVHVTDSLVWFGQEASEDGEVTLLLEAGSCLQVKVKKIPDGLYIVRGTIRDDDKANAVGCRWVATQPLPVPLDSILWCEHPGYPQEPKQG